VPMLCFDFRHCYRERGHPSFALRYEHRSSRYCSLRWPPLARKEKDNREGQRRMMGEGRREGDWLGRNLIFQYLRMNTSDDESLSFAVDTSVLQKEEHGRAFGGCDLV